MIIFAFNIYNNLKIHILEKLYKQRLLINVDAAFTQITVTRSNLTNVTRKQMFIQCI